MKDLSKKETNKLNVSFNLDDSNENKLFDKNSNIHRIEKENISKNINFKQNQNQSQGMPSKSNKQSLSHRISIGLQKIKDNHKDENKFNPILINNSSNSFDDIITVKEKSKKMIEQKNVANENENRINLLNTENLSKNVVNNDNNIISKNVISNKISVNNVGNKIVNSNTIDNINTHIPSKQTLINKNSIVYKEEVLNMSKLKGNQISDNALPITTRLSINNIKTFKKIKPNRKSKNAKMSIIDMFYNVKNQVDLDSSILEEQNTKLYDIVENELTNDKNNDNFSFSNKAVNPIQISNANLNFNIVHESNVILNNKTNIQEEKRTELVTKEDNCKSDNFFFPYKSNNKVTDLYSNNENYNSNNDNLKNVSNINSIYGHGHGQTIGNYNSNEYNIKPQLEKYNSEMISKDILKHCILELKNIQEKIDLEKNYIETKQTHMKKVIKSIKEKISNNVQFANDIIKRSNINNKSQLIKEFKNFLTHSVGIDSNFDLENGLLKFKLRDFLILKLNISNISINSGNETFIYIDYSHDFHFEKIYEKMCSSNIIESNSKVNENELERMTKDLVEMFIDSFLKNSLNKKVNISYFFNHIFKNFISNFFKLVFCIKYVINTSCNYSDTMENVDMEINNHKRQSTFKEISNLSFIKFTIVNRLVTKNGYCITYIIKIYISPFFYNEEDYISEYKHQKLIISFEYQSIIKLVDLKEGFAEEKINTLNTKLIQVFNRLTIETNKALSIGGNVSRIIKNFFELIRNNI